MLPVKSLRKASLMFLESIVQKELNDPSLKQKAKSELREIRNELKRRFSSLEK